MSPCSDSSLCRKRSICSRRANPGAPRRRGRAQREVCRIHTNTEARRTRRIPFEQRRNKGNGVVFSVASVVSLFIHLLRDSVVRIADSEISNLKSAILSAPSASCMLTNTMRSRSKVIVCGRRQIDRVWASQCRRRAGSAPPSWNKPEQPLGVLGTANGQFLRGPRRKSSRKGAKPAKNPSFFAPLRALRLCVRSAWVAGDARTMPFCGCSVPAFSVSRCPWCALSPRLCGKTPPAVPYPHPIRNSQSRSPAFTPARTGPYHAPRSSPDRTERTRP